MTQRCGYSQLKDAALHNLLPHLYPARLRILRGNTTAENLKRRTEDGKKGTEHSSEWRDRQARELSLSQISEGNGAREKGKRKLCRKIETKTECESAGVVGGRVKNLASKTPSGRKNAPERATYETQLARTEWTSSPHPAGATSKPGEEFPGKRSQEN